MAKYLFYNRLRLVTHQ